MFGKICLELMVEFKVFILKNGGSPMIFPKEYEKYIIEKNELEEGVFCTLKMPLEEFTKFIKENPQEILFYA